MMGPCPRTWRCSAPTAMPCSAVTRTPCSTFWSPDFVSHVTARVNPDAVGTDVRAQELEWWTQVRSAFPDIVFSVDLLIESDDLVVSNWTVRGTHTGTAFYGVEPSGEPVTINGTAILRLRDGKVVEHWGGPHCQDGVGLTH